MKRIALCIELAPDQQRRLLTEIGADELVVLTGDHHSEECLAGCEIVFGNPPAKWLDRASSVRWVQLESVGFGEYTSMNWTDLQHRLTLTNLAGFFADPVAETTLAGLLAIARGIDRLVILKSTATWEGDPQRTRLTLLRGTHVVLVGFGSINRRLAELLTPFRCRITAIRRDTPINTLDAALKEADIVVCTAPDTSETRNLFDENRLSLLPTRAIFANLGRGTIVDETALANALTSGKLAGAVLDVTRMAPLPAEHRLWHCPNTLLTQHSGGGTADELERKIDVFVENLARYRRSEPLKNTVDFQRGY